MLSGWHYSCETADNAVSESSSVNEKEWSSTHKYWYTQKTDLQWWNSKPCNSAYVYKHWSVNAIMIVWFIWYITCISNSVIYFTI